MMNTMTYIFIRNAVMLDVYRLDVQQSYHGILVPDTGTLVMYDTVPHIYNTM